MTETRALGAGYLLHESIGTGAMGNVWRGVRRSDGAPVAVKILHADLTADPASVARFLQERTMLTTLRDPHIVEVYDLVAEGDTLGIVMELVTGPDLRHYLSAAGSLPEREAAHIMAQVARALVAAHRAGVVHRDLKPENVLLEVDNSPRVHARVCDFGIARLAEGSTLTQMTGFVGTPAYMAPEVARGDDSGSPVDVYAAGTMLYELVTGHTPFVGDNPFALLRRQADEEPARPPIMSDPMWDLTERLLTKDPGARPDAVSAANSLADLADELGMPSTSSHAAQPAGSVTRSLTPTHSSPARRKRLATTLAVVVGAVLLAALAVGGVVVFGGSGDTSTGPSSWSAATFQHPDTNRTAQLNEVSCTSPSWCVAVGSAADTGTLVETWNGSEFTVAPSQQPPNAQDVELMAVSCAAQSGATAPFCAGVGYFRPDSSHAYPLVVIPSGAQPSSTAWTTLTPPAPGGDTAAVLVGASCTSATFCMAVGYHGNTFGVGGNDTVYAMQWDGTAWHAVPIPSPPDTFASLNGVSCVSPQYCKAVGTGNGTLSETWDGSSWTLDSTPNPPRAQVVSVTGVSCSSATHCFAVGGWNAQSSNSTGDHPGDHLLSMQWDGSSWQLVPIPDAPNRPASELNDVSCPSDTFCTAAGWSSRGIQESTSDATLLEEWDGKAWTLTTSPVGPPSPGVLTPNGTILGISCLASTYCIATGYTQESSVVPYALLQVHR